MSRQAALVAAVVLISCANLPTRAPFTPDVAVRLVPVRPYPELDRWWGEVQTCTGRPTHASRPDVVLWGDTALTADQVTALDGAYLLDRRLIIVRAYDPRIIRHEMAHALLAPDTSHPGWVGVRCGAILRWP